MSVLAERCANVSFEISIKKAPQKGADKSPIQSRLESYQPRVVSLDAASSRISEAATRRCEIIVQTRNKAASHNKKVLNFSYQQKKGSDCAAAILERELTHKQKIAAEHAATFYSKKVHHLNQVNNTKISCAVAAVKRRTEDAKILEIYIDEKLDSATEKRAKIAAEVLDRLNDSSERRMSRAQIAHKNQKHKSEDLDRVIVLKAVEAETRKEKLQFEQVSKLVQQTQGKLERGAKALKKLDFEQLNITDAKIASAQERKNKILDNRVLKVAKRTYLTLSNGAEAIKRAENKSRQLNEAIMEKLEASGTRKNTAIAERVNTIAKSSASKLQRSEIVTARYDLEAKLLGSKIENMANAAAMRKEARVSKSSEKVSKQIKKKIDQIYDSSARFTEEARKLQDTGRKRLFAAAERKKRYDQELLAKVSRSAKIKADRLAKVVKHKRNASYDLDVNITCKIESATKRREQRIRARVKHASYCNRQKLGICYIARRSAEKSAKELLETVEAKLMMATERKEKFLEGIVEKVAIKNRRKCPSSATTFLTPRSKGVALATLEQRLSDASARRSSLLAQRSEQAQLRNRRRVRSQQIDGIMTQTTSSTVGESAENSVAPPQCVEPSLASTGNSGIKRPSPCSDFSESHPKKLFGDTTFGLSLSTILLTTNDQEAGTIESNSQRSSLVITSNESEDQVMISPLPSPSDSNSWDHMNGYVCSIM